MKYSLQWRNPKTPDYWKQSNNHRGNNWIEYEVSSDKECIDKILKNLSTDYPNHEWKVGVFP